MASTSRNWLNTPVLHPVWRKLPVELVETVLKCVPFQSLVRFRAVCKWFNCLISTPKFARECQKQKTRKSVPVIVRRSITLKSCSMEVLDSETNSWLTHTLPILKPSLYPLKLSATSGGLLCFVTQGYGRFVVCNPLTEAFRLLKFPFLVINDICSLVRGQAAFTVLVADFQVGTFTLVIVITSGEIERKTFLYDSVDGTWRSGAPLPHTDDFISADISDKFIKSLTFNGSIYVLLVTGTFDRIRYRLLKYNVCRDKWTEISRSDLLHFDYDVDILEHQGQVVVVSLTRQWLPNKYLQISLPHSDFQINSPIANCRVIQAVVGHGETLVENKVMFQVLLRNFDTYQGWMNAATFNNKHTTIGIGNISCMARDPYRRMQVLHFNCNSKKFSLLPVFPKMTSYNRPQDIFELNLLEPSLTIDL